MTINSQLATWRGEFGEAYTKRNQVDWRIRLPAFREAVGDLPLRRLLEVGCNRGHNLVALGEALGAGCAVVGIEPNDHARGLARLAAGPSSVVGGDVLALPFARASFDLAMTVGVLIHVPPENLHQAMAEIFRVSRRYILCAEYFAEVETPIRYRGRDDLLWKRDFLTHYKDEFPGLAVVRQGFWSAAEGFDRTHWWLLEKP